MERLQTLFGGGKARTCGCAGRDEEDTLVVPPPEPSEEKEKPEDKALRCLLCLVPFAVFLVVYSIFKCQEGLGPFGPVIVPGTWRGPLPPSPLLWGGPSEGWASQQFTTKTIEANGVETSMDYAREGSDIPSSLQGIFWMDQFGVSSVATDPDYGFRFSGLPEVLISFGTAGGDGTTFQRDTGCVTPVPFYAGGHLTALNNADGQALLDFHRRCRTTLSFCIEDGGRSVKIYQKMVTQETSLGPVKIGSLGAFLFGYPNAGGGYSWTTDTALSMSMVVAPHGWDRITSALRLVPFLPGIDGKYPVLQIVDGRGRRTKYYDEYLRAMANVPNGAGASFQVGVPGR